MFKSMFNKSLSVAGVFCALAMNVNTALGMFSIDIEAWLNEPLSPTTSQEQVWYEKFNKLKLDKAIAIFIAERAGFSQYSDETARAICFLLWLGHTPNEIGTVSSKCLQELGKTDECLSEKSIMLLKRLDDPSPEKPKNLEKIGV